MTVVHIGESRLQHLYIRSLVIWQVGIQSSADPSAQANLVSSFEELTQKCVNPKTGEPLITSFKCGKQNSPEGMTKGLEMVFVLEFEVRFYCPLIGLGELRYTLTNGFCETRWIRADGQNIEDRDYYLDDPAHVEFKVSLPSLGATALLAHLISLPRPFQGYYQRCRAKLMIESSPRFQSGRHCDLGFRSWKVEHLIARWMDGLDRYTAGITGCDM